MIVLIYMITIRLLHFHHRNLTKQLFRLGKWYKWKDYNSLTTVYNGHTSKEDNSDAVDTKCLHSVLYQCQLQPMLRPPEVCTFTGMYLFVLHMMLWRMMM